VTALYVIWNIAYWVLLLYFFVMWGRLLVDLVRSINHGWRPSGFLLVLIELGYSITDPLIRLFRRILPPIRIGPVSFDLAWSLAMLLVVVGMNTVSWLARISVGG